MTKGDPAATIVITTRNRKEELRQALLSAFAQDVPVEVIVTDDASEDGTLEMVQQEFPAARILRSDQCLGLLVQRNRAAVSSSCDIIFSLDDDATFGSSDTVRKTLTEFSDARIGAVAIPHVDTQTGKAVNPQAPDDGRIWCVAYYTGTAHALRRDVFRSLGGYREDLVHQGEESDFCIRMLAVGFVTRLGRAPFLQHHESPRRSFTRMDHYGRRNDLLFAWRHAPAAWLGPHLLATTLNGLRSAAACGRWRSQIGGIVAGWRAIFNHSYPREPVSTPVYRTFRTLKKRGPKMLEDIAQSLPAVHTELRQ
jgi:GT2 family glycosyltransferase